MTNEDSGRSAAPTGLTYDIQPFYEYDSRADPQTSFRFLDLGPLEADGVIRGITSQREVDTAANYVAISCAWGAPGANISIEVDNMYFKIRKNLHNCLLEYCRRLQSAGKIFVDAICIDQSNYDERNTQVRLMGRVFRQAQEVFVWLGQPTPVVKTVFDLIHFLSESPHSWQEFLTTFPQPTLSDGMTCLACIEFSPNNRIYRLQDQSSRVMGCTAKEQFMAFHETTRSYFARCWIIQELVSAKQAT